MSDFQFKEAVAKRNPKDTPNSPFPLALCFGSPANRKYLIGAQHYVGYIDNNSVIIRDVTSIENIYYMGYFGKGTLSRSAPEHLNSPASSSKKNKEGDFLEIEVLTPDDEDSDSFKTLQIESLKRGHQDMSEDVTKPPEVLQLMFEEAYFLSYALGCLVVKKYGISLTLLQLWNECCSLASGDKFPITYAAYHHFRSKGWVVRSGSKFGADFLLYKDGPAFYHASYSVIVKKANSQNVEDERVETWKELSAFNRVTESVGKEVLLCFVIVPSTVSSDDLKSPTCIQQFQIKEVIARRWVTSEERIQESDET